MVSPMKQVSSAARAAQDTAESTIAELRDGRFGDILRRARGRADFLHGTDHLPSSPLENWWLAVLPAAHHGRHLCTFERSD